MTSASVHVCCTGCGFRSRRILSNSRKPCPRCAHPLEPRFGPGGTMPYPYERQRVHISVRVLRKTEKALIAAGYRSRSGAASVILDAWANAQESQPSRRKAQRLRTA